MLTKYFASFTEARMCIICASISHRPEEYEDSARATTQHSMDQLWIAKFFQFSKYRNSIPYLEVCLIFICFSSLCRSY